MDAIGKAIKEHLEATYDIPFCVNCGSEYKDVSYRIWPDNELGELFEIRMLYRQEIRLIIDITPQKYAAEMLNDMQRADDEKICVFLKYIESLRKRNAKIEMSLNQNLCKEISKELWTQTWKSLKIRISAIPEKNSEDDKAVNLFIKWAESVVGMMLALLNIEKLDAVDKLYLEGGCNKVLTNKYERNPVNRQLCLMANGYCCKICGFDFEKMYGSLGKDFIHVHHIEKVSSHKTEYLVNPVVDLIPVCPNCHAMLHREEPPMRPDKLIEIIKSIKENGQGE